VVLLKRFAHEVVIGTYLNSCGRTLGSDFERAENRELLGITGQNTNIGFGEGFDNRTRPSPRPLGRPHDNPDADNASVEIARRIDEEGMAQFGHGCRQSVFEEPA
jgi:hypothetical protein